jgi:hypothetical protein
MRWLVVCIVMVAPLPAWAQSLAFFGTVGRAPVFVSLQREGDALSGWYLYVRQGKSIRLQGIAGADGFALDEFSFHDGRKTGHFAGVAGARDWSGEWQAADGRMLTFTLRPARDTLNGRFRCGARTSESGYRFQAALDLEAVKGRVTRFTLSHDATGFGDAQSCSIGLGDLRQERSQSGILLRAREDDVSDTGEAAQHCSVRVLGSGDALVVEVNGCKGAGDTMFCSARGSWSDLVLDRKTQACRAIE